MNALMVSCCGNEKPRISAKFQNTGFLNELPSLEAVGGNDRSRIRKISFQMKLQNAEGPGKAIDT
jgi:hypothetical protein